MTLAGLLSGRRRRPERSAAPPAVTGAPDAISASAAAAVTRSHVGRVRTVNEDRVFAGSARGLWAVADGMGGHFAGDVAAEAIVDALRDLAEAPGRFDDDAIDATLIAAGRRICDRATGSTRVSGSTVVALHVDGPRGTLFWAGDSRAYRMRDGAIEQLSRDHSVVQDLVDAGALTPAQADRHPQAHVITRALGAARDVAIERRTIAVRPGDLYLLCSDGLTRGGGDPALGAGPGRPLDAIADALLATALAAGGADNISLVLIAIP